MYSQDGATFLMCRAQVMKTVVHEDDPHWLAIYATIDGFRDVRCLFHYCTEDRDGSIEVGSYQIYAVVRR